MHDRPAQFIENHDGDSVTMMLDQNFECYKKARLRLANVWAPESDEPGGLEVEMFVFQWLTKRTVRHIPGKWPFIVYTSTTKTGKPLKTFDRYVATVMTHDLGECLNTDVMRFILEKGYGGGTGAPKPQGFQQL